MITATKDGKTYIFTRQDDGTWALAEDNAVVVTGLGALKVLVELAWILEEKKG